MTPTSPLTGNLSLAKNFKQAVQNENPLQIVGVINAYCALLAEQAGFNAIYVSGAGVANASFGLPDLGLTSRNDVLEDVRRITATTQLPVLVDVDTGWGDVLNVARTVTQMMRAGAAAIHLEDQAQSKRCGHRPNKTVVSIAKMVDRIKAAVDARSHPDFVIMARTDAYSVEGLNSAIDRAHAYLEAGADMIFAESMGLLSDYATFCRTVKAPVLANVTEFGKTPLFTVEELRAAGVRLILYPLSAFRAMSHAASLTYQTIRKEGTQKNVLPLMQTREELYRCLDYYRYEKIVDLFDKDEVNE